MTTRTVIWGGMFSEQRERILGNDITGEYVQSRDT